MFNLKSSYKILKEYNLLIEVHSGTIDFESYVNFKKKVISDSEFSPNLNFLINFTNAFFTITNEEIEYLVDFISKNSKLNNKRYTALVTDTPNQLVSSTLFKILQNNPLRPVEIFSTNECALEWLNCNDLPIDKILNELNNS